MTVVKHNILNDIAVIEISNPPVNAISAAVRRAGIVDIHGARSNAYAFININEKTVSDVLPTDSNVGEIQSGESILITEDQLLPWIVLG